MAGIAGIEGQGKHERVAQMLRKMAHRGKAGSRVIESHGATLGAIWPEAQIVPTPPTLRRQAVWDGCHPPLPNPASLGRVQEPFALTAALPEGLFLARDLLGVCPLYYGRTEDNLLCFASEVKALLGVAQTIHEVPPGSWYDGQQGFTTYATVEPGFEMSQEAAEIAADLRLYLEQAISRRISDQVTGCWLSGGLDSSVMAALARPHVNTLHTFSGGMAGAPDLEAARHVADALGTEHHETIVTLKELLAALPEVIYHLESFDALLVRSSVTNYLVAKQAADYVGEVFSGEGADELFGGYSYLKEMDLRLLSDELKDITHRLHNTALQRVDRSASAHGLIAHVAFLDLDVVRYAMSIPSRFKLWRTDDALVEKWILRQALSGELPEDIVWRQKAKFWQGTGVGELLSQHAEETVSNEDFARERELPNGWTLNTKEELLYYRVFREQFGQLPDLSWMGRTKGAPKQE